jgi:hypothetical protein
MPPPDFWGKTDLISPTSAAHLSCACYHSLSSLPRCPCSLKEFLPMSYMRQNKIEKKIFQEHKKLMGTSEIDAKVRYVKLARSLPTFGVHFFLVKVRQRICKSV